ncbi:hypothetical protein Tco_1028420 [Tanacetum coccineum]|uniref:Uncharacterized protein n=1 Tax=Tanacetum coccineum TaxID=301880 RepID=A0ABQ5G0X8_9ASTR
MFSTIGYSGEIKAKGSIRKGFLPPRVDIDYARLIWEDIINKLITREKVFLYPRFFIFAAKTQDEGTIYSASTIIHSESASGNDASTASIAKVDPRKYDPHDSVSKQQAEPEKDTRNAEKEVRFGDDEFNTSPNLSIFDDAKKEIKLDDLSKLAHNVEVDFYGP